MYTSEMHDVVSRPALMHDNKSGTLRNQIGRIFSSENSEFGQSSYTDGQNEK